MTPRTPIVPKWSWSLVLLQLTEPCFETIATCSFQVLTFKTAFLVTVTSTEWISNLTALKADYPFLQFYDNRVTLQPSVKYLPKVVSKFHLGQDFFCQFFLPKSFHNGTVTTDFKYAILLYLSRSYFIGQSFIFVVCRLLEGLDGLLPDDFQMLVETIRKIYELASAPCLFCDKHTQLDPSLPPWLWLVVFH